jgi:predicted kinase
MKTVVILRGTSGSGKSTFADYLAGLSHLQGATICCADDYMLENGEYKFSVDKLDMAHTKCKKKFLSALIHDIPLVIVANTNTRLNEIQFYLDVAKIHGYTVFSLVVENRADTQSVHNVPQQTLERQCENLRQNLKLI